MKLRNVAFLAFAFSGCATVDFDSNPRGAVYYEPLPYVFYSITEKCVSSVAVVTLPGKRRYLDFRGGYGSSNLSAEFSNGLLIKVGQTSDSKVPETLTAVAAIATAAALLTDTKAPCSALAVLYPIVDGEPDTSRPFVLGTK